MVLPTKFLKQTKQLELTMTQMSQDCLKGLWFCLGPVHELWGA